MIDFSETYHIKLLLLKLTDFNNIIGFNCGASALKISSILRTKL